MNLQFVCECGQRIVASARCLGWKVPCSHCGRELLLTQENASQTSAAPDDGLFAPSALPPDPTGMDLRIKFFCRCGHKLRMDPKHAGKKGKCPSCSHLLRVPAVNHESLKCVCACGKTFVVSRDRIGQRVRCSRCSRPLVIQERQRAIRVQRPLALPRDLNNSDPRIYFNCECGHKICVQPIMAGKIGSCPECQSLIQVPGTPIQESAEDMGQTA